MAQRDSQLVIRAKDEASKTLEQITKALDAFKAAQGGIAGPAGATASTMEKLAASIGAVGATIQALSGVEKIAAQFARAEGAVNALDAKLTQTKQSVAGYESALVEAATRTRAFESSLKGSQAALEAQKLKVDSLKAAEKGLAAETVAAEKAIKELDAANATGPASERKTALYATLSRLENGRLAAAKAAQTTLGQNLAEEQAKQAALITSHRELARATKASANEQAVLAANLRVAGSNVAGLTEGLDKAKVGLGEVADKFRAGATAAGLNIQTVKELGDAQLRLKTLATDAAAVLAAQGRPGAVGRLPGAGESSAAVRTAAYRSLVAAQAAASLASTEEKAKLSSLYQTTGDLTKATTEQVAAINLQRAAWERATAQSKAADAALVTARDMIRQEVAGRKDEAAANERAKATAEALSAQMKALAASQAQVATSTDGVARATRAAVAGYEAERAAATQLKSALAGVKASKDSLVGSIKTLAGAYIGIYGAIAAYKNVLQASTDLEAAQIRIATALGQGQEKGAEAFEHVANAARQLKIDILPTVDEYGRFVASVKGSALEGQKGVRVFDDLLVTARAFKLSPENIDRAVLALKDMASKGNLARREINQLDMALPVGLFPELAKAANLSLAEFGRQVHAGKIGLDILVPAFDAIRERAEKGLPQALNTTQSALADLRNAFFDFKTKIGSGEFLEGSKDAITSVAQTLRDPQTIKGIQALAGGIAQIVALLAKGLPYLGEFAPLIASLGAIKLASVVLPLEQIWAALRGAGAAVAVLRTGMIAIAAGGALEGVAGGLGLVLGLLTGPVGIAALVASIGVGFLLWRTNANSAANALESYNALLAQIRAGQAGNGGDLSKSIGSTPGGATIKQVEDEFSKQKALYQDFATTFEASISSLTGRGVAGYDELAKSIQSGTLSYEEIIQKLKDFAAALPAGKLKDHINAMAEQAKATEDARGRLGSLGVVLKAVGVATADLDKIILQSNGDFDGAAAAAQKYTDAMNKVTEAIKGVSAAEADKIKAKIKAGRDAVDGATGVDARSAALIATNEGFQETAKFDVNAYRAGFGSDTKTDAQGKVTAIQQGESVSRADASRDLLRRTAEFRDIVKKQLGPVWDSLSESQQASLVDMAYNYGSLPDDVVRAIVGGKAEDEVAKIIEDHGSDNAGVNRGRRAQEAAIYQGDTGTPAEIVAEGVKAADEANKKKEKTDKAVEAAQNSAGLESENTLVTRGLSDFKKANPDATQAEIEARQKLLEGKKEELELTREIAKFKTDNPDASAAQLAAFSAATKQRLDLARASANDKNESGNTKSDAVQTEKELNALFAQRASLKRDLDSESNTATKEEDKKSIEELDVKIKAAMESARKFYETLGGEAGKAGLARLDALDAKLDSTKDEFTILNLDAKQTKSVFTDLGNGIVGMFDNFAKSVANGVKPLVAARQAFLQFASEFLQKIAQMILQQAIFNALGIATGGGFTGGGLLGSFGLKHSGGMIGGGTSASKRVPITAFAGARRYHSGGMPGFGPDEVPIIAQKGEEMLSKGDPRNRANGALGRAVNSSVKVVNAFDAGSFLSHSLSTPDGEEAFMNFVRANPGSIKGALGG